MTAEKAEKRQIRLVVIGLMMGMLLGALDQTIVSTAMPTVIKDLGGFSLYSWVFSIYMLTSTTAVPIFGKLADLYGRRLIYMIGIGFFILGSALCGLSSNMTELIIFRGFQGIGAGALMPIAMVIIGDIFPPERRGKMQGVFGAVFGLSSVIGPAVGGFLVEQINWHWIFYVNLPFGIVAAAMIAVALKESKGNEKKSIDWLGAVVLTGAIVSLLLALVMGGNAQEPGAHYAWGSPQIIGLFTITAVLVALFLWIESKAKEPILPLFLFKNRVFTSANLVGFFLGAGMFGAITYIPLFVQAVIGTSPSRAGYVLTPLMISLIVASIIGGRLVSKVSYRSIIIYGMSVMAIGFYLMSTMDIHTSNSTVILYMIITGLGMGPMMPTLTIAVQSIFGKELRGVATSSSQFFRSIGGTIGVSVMGAIMANRMTAGIADLSNKLTAIPKETFAKFSNPQVLLQPELKGHIPKDLLTGILNVLTNSIHLVFIIGLILVLIGLVCGFLMGRARLLKNPKDSSMNNAASMGEDKLKPELESF